MCSCVHSHIGWKYLLILQVFLQGDAASHDGCELDVVHSICTGVFGQVFFDDFATNPSDKASNGCGVEERFDELVVRHGGVYIGFLRFVWFRVVVVLCLHGRQLLLLQLPVNHPFKRRLEYVPGCF